MKLQRLAIPFFLLLLVSASALFAQPVQQFLPKRQRTGIHRGAFDDSQRALMPGIGRGQGAG